MLIFIHFELDLKQPEDSSSSDITLVTYRGVVGGDVEQNFGGASAGDVPVAVPHARYQVGLASQGKNQNAD